MQMIHATPDHTPEGRDLRFVVHLNEQTDQKAAAAVISALAGIANDNGAFDVAHNLTEWAKPAILADLCKPENPGQSGVQLPCETGGVLHSGASRYFEFQSSTKSKRKES